LIGVFRRLADEFEFCVNGLKGVKGDLRQEPYRIWKKALLNR